LDKYLENVAWWRLRCRPPHFAGGSAGGLTPINPEYARLVALSRCWSPVQENGLCRAFNLAKEKAPAKGVMVPEAATFRDLRAGGRHERVRDDHG
jgi:hypothetical protein